MLAPVVTSPAPASYRTTRIQQAPVIASSSPQHYEEAVPDLLAARLQMAVSLGFHIVFAVVGMAMPVMMVAAEFRYAKSKDAVYLDLAHRWAKGTAILFAVGAVSG